MLMRPFPFWLKKIKESHTTDKKQILDYEYMHVKKQSSKF